jgi:GT2 family glycosyltransferase/glycosyltransferase involved in cell wall biosynthesis
MPSHALKRLARKFVPYTVRNYLRTKQKQLRRAFRPLDPVPTYDVVYVLTIVGLCGGIRVIMEHVSRLRARGYRVGVFAVCGDTDWFPRDVPVHYFGTQAELQRQLNAFRGIKVATWYETAPLVAASLRGQDRGYYMVQDIEESYCDDDEQKRRVAATYRLGLQTLSEGFWVERQLRERFGLDPVQVRIGVDFEMFQPRGGIRRPHQIMTQARTWSGGVGAGRRIKGWDIALAVIHRTWARNPKTELLTFSIEEAPAFPEGLPHQHYQRPSDRVLSELYSTAGLYLLTSRHEGFGLTPAEAMACGCPVVATRAHGNEEFCIDGQTALTADPDDLDRLTQHCLLLQNDPHFAAELGERGRRFIQEYTWDRVIDGLEREFFRKTGPIELPPHDRSAAARVTQIMQLRPEELRRRIPLSDVEYPDLELNGPAACDFTVVIPTVGSAQKVMECVSSCRRFADPQQRLQIIVVDDGCPDAEALEVLREAAKEGDFELRENRQNLGFSAAVNHGLRQARGEFLLVCNNDILFDRPWMHAVRRAFDYDPRVGIVSARLLYPDGWTIQHAGTEKAPGHLAYGHSFHRARADLPAAKEPRYVWYATGALLALRRSTVQRLGGLSTGYGLAYEDLDYCLRAWLMGVRVLYWAEFTARHQEGGTRGASDEQKRTRPLVWLLREDSGRAYFHRKWAPMQNVEDLAPFLRFSATGSSDIIADAPADSAGRHVSRSEGLPKARPA